MSNFRLTKHRVMEAFAPLAEADRTIRSRFFTDSTVPDVVWTVTGSAHSLAGTRYSLQAHADATITRAEEKLVAPIKFHVVRVVVDAEASSDGWWACVESKGEAVMKTGQDYNNDYIFLTRWNDQGKIVEIRSYFDTVMSDNLVN